MAQLSKRVLNKEIEERLFEVFWDSVSRIKNSKQAEDFYSDLFSPTEKLMFAKRLGIALMLLKGKSYGVISDILKVSTTTVMNVNQWLKGGKGGYSGVLKDILKNEKWESLLGKLDEMISKITVPRPGSDWRRAKSEEWQRRNKRKRQLHSL